ncbi:hypothetical protein Cgig2_011734 [Carnegiea gigantea]|uniref:25S rRNA (uridine-N(3))-methyltransferase BMT5-like domain-containing protein n=1 Tax=Carnegiea gigantea TaxID=171969 RepID=A0A9Q1KK83_9CARY|nr:hypothetical protein Cgig2_011734 [Carnegiea gigantea]
MRTRTYYSCTIQCDYANADGLKRKHRKAKSNLDKLQKLGAILIHGVDAMRINFQGYLQASKFDRIVFNFPHAGFHGREDSHHLIIYLIFMIRKRRRLVDGFFYNASSMLRPDGEIHIRHKTYPPFGYWKLEELASWNSLLLVEFVPFRIWEYPAYVNRRGDGSRSGEPFPSKECSTFKFILSTAARHYLERSLTIIIIIEGLLQGT